MVAACLFCLWLRTKAGSNPLTASIEVRNIRGSHNPRLNTARAFPLCLPLLAIAHVADRGTGFPD